MRDRSSRERALRRERETAPKSTPPQRRFLDELLIDAGFAAAQRRNAYLTRVVGRPVKYLDELTLREAGALIEVLLARRTEERAEARKSREPAEG